MPPSQPIQAPSLARITGSSAVTSPPGERRQLVRCRRRATTRSTGSRLATMTRFAGVGHAPHPMWRRIVAGRMTSLWFVAYSCPDTSTRPGGDCAWTPRTPAPATARRRTGPRLSDRDREILEFERQWWKYAGAKEHAVREKFDMSSTRYYQVLNALIDRPEALEADPLLVRRLRRLRAARQRHRSARRLGFEV